MNEVRRFLTGIVSGGEDLDLLCSVLSELFANAIEHGLLELDSSLKETPDGFLNSISYVINDWKPYPNTIG